MAKILNYNGKLAIKGLCNGDLHSLFFNSAEAFISLDTVSSSYKNIYGNEFVIKKGFKTNATVKIYLPVNAQSVEHPELNQINKLRIILSNMSAENAVNIVFYLNDLTILQTFTFDSLDSDLPYTDFFKKNSNLGIEIEFKLSCSSTINDAPAFWEKTI